MHHAVCRSPTWKPTSPPSRLGKQCFVAKPTQGSHGPRLSRKKTTQNTPKRVCGGDEKTGKNNRPTTHTEERKRERLARKGKSHFAYEDTKKQKRAPSRGDRETPSRHAAVEEGSWPHRYPAHFPAKITRALHSPPSLVVVLWPTSFRYPYSIRLHASPVNASDRQLHNLPCRPLTSSSLLTSPSRQGFAHRINTPDTNLRRILSHAPDNFDSHNLPS